MHRHLAILKLLRALIVAVVFLQCGASLALTVHEGWHEAVHHHDGDEDHDCPVVQLAHGFWDAPAVPALSLPRPPLPSGSVDFPDTARRVSALFLSISVLEHAPPVCG